VYLAGNAGIETAERFLANAEKGFGDLARHPDMAAALSLRSPRLAGLRKWQVSGFEKMPKSSPAGRWREKFSRRPLPPPPQHHFLSRAA
jgi:hypothetical protein